MEGIYQANPEFNFNQLKLISPTSVTGGNYFIKFRLNDNPLYIQPPKCVLKNGIQKSGKKLFSDLIFTHENEEFIQWMENLEIYCRKQLFENRAKWFETELDETDIENFFTSPIKIFKSGKNYVVRTNVPTLLGNCNLKIYNEEEEEMSMDKIKENDNVVSVLEFQGIKCSPRNFQIDIEIKQMMILNAVSLFETCVFTPNKSVHNNNTVKQQQLQEEREGEEEKGKEKEKENAVPAEKIEDEPNTSLCDDIVETPLYLEEKEQERGEQEKEQEEQEEEDKREQEGKKERQENPNQKNRQSYDMEEIEFDLDELPPESAIQIKQRDTVYYDMYKEAKRKAKMARDLAISSFLEAKNIKQTYMLDDIEDSDSDLDENDLDIF
jgi:hypothetical protein